MDTADRITANLRVGLRHDGVVMHVPVEVAVRAREAAATHNVDAIVSVDGAGQLAQAARSRHPAATVTAVVTDTEPAIPANRLI
jgi:hypothetical protein